MPENTGRIGEIIDKWLDAIIFMLFSAIMIIVGMNVALRYVFSHPVFWVTEAAGDLLVYMIFFGSAQALYRDEHIRIKSGLEELNPGMSAILAYIRTSCVYLFIGLTIAFGLKLTFLNMRSYTGTLSIPMGVVYAAAPASGVLMGVQYTMRLIKGRR